MEHVYTLALFFLMAVAAFWAGTRLARSRPDTTSATPEAESVLPDKEKKEESSQTSNQIWLDYALEEKAQKTSSST